MPVLSTVLIYIFKSLLLTTIRSQTLIKTSNTFMRHETALSCLASQSLSRLTSKVCLTYQKQLLISCVCSLDILQRWKAAWQVICLQEFIGRFANCLVDSRSNHQEIKAFSFRRETMHRWTTTTTEDKVNRYGVGNSCKTKWYTPIKVNGLHTHLNTGWKLTTIPLTSLGQVLLLWPLIQRDVHAYLCNFMNITKNTWLLLLLL